MARGKTVGWLIALNCVSFAALVLIMLFSEAIDQMPMLGLLAAPFILSMPFGPPILLMALFSMLGPSQRPAKRLARIGAALLFCAALFLVMVSYASVDRFAMTATDSAIAIGLTVAGALVAWVGFRPDTHQVSDA
jgi:hypothetical protein